METYREAVHKGAGKPTAALVAAVVECKLAATEGAREVVEHKLTTSPVAPATKPVDPEDDENPPHFQNIDESREAFAAVLGAQKEHEAVLTKHNYSRQKKVVKEADATLKETLAWFSRRLPGPAGEWGVRGYCVIVHDGQAYAAEEYGSREWEVANLVNLDLPND